MSHAPGPKRRYPGHGLTLANRITLARLLGVPVFVLVLLYAGQGPAPYLRWTATVLFLAMGLTDALDGYVARARNERSRLGTLLDPLADKALLLSALVVLAGPWGRAFEPHVPLWYVFLVLTRDVILIAGYMGIHHFAGEVHVRPSYAGKLATALQMVIILWVLTGLGERGFAGLLGTAAACVGLSGAQYIIAGIRQLEHAHAREAGYERH